MLRDPQNPWDPHFSETINTDAPATDHPFSPYFAPDHKAVSATHLNGGRATRSEAQVS